jgi:choline dehydrogenase-like flavoprotein
MHPSDFRLASLYGVGRDWPIGYDDLEPYYSAAEEIMSISGDDASAAAFPRSAPYPQPPHRMTSADEVLAAAFPGLHFPMPTARSRVPTPGRGVCCATAACNLCPNDAKFTAHNGMAAVFADPRVSVLVHARVTGIETRAGTVSAVEYEHGGAMHRALCELCVLGANAIFSPYILEQSGMGTPLTGKGICEQLGVEFVAHLDGLDALDGSTVLTGLNHLLFDGEHRREAGAAAIHFRSHWRYGGLRLEEGRWRQTLPFLAVIEDLPDDANRVGASERPGVPLVHHPRGSAYAERGLARVRARLEDLLQPLPVEAVFELGPRPTESHLQGTLRMGSDPAESVVDADLVHHRWRNLIVVGSSVFPTCQTANPSLTVAALALRAGERAA